MTSSRRRFLGIGAILPLAGCSAGAAELATESAALLSAAPTPAAAPSSRTGPLIIPVWQQLFGPVQMQSTLRYVPHATWQWPGTALTPSTKPWRLDMNVAPVRSAIFRVIWTSVTPAHWIRLVHADDGPANVTSIAEIQSLGHGLNAPRNQVADVTAAINALRAGGVYKNLGFQIHGDGATEMEIWEVRLELNFEVTP